MYDEQMENLISAALADGVLTDKEKEVLFKKAESMGIDLDEFEMVLDARFVEQKKKEAREAAQYELEMEKAKASQKSLHKSVKYGDVRKCPACGAMVGTLQIKCPECGHEFTNVGACSTTQKLLRELDEVERETNSSVLGGISKFYFGHDKATTRKTQIIKNFPIPNTKEDLLEMLTLCYSNSEARTLGTGASEGLLIIAWQTKAQQVVEKAKIMLCDVPEAQEIIGKIEKKARRRKRTRICLIGAAVAIAVFLYSWVGISIHSESEEKEQIAANIKNLSSEIDSKLASGDIDAAANVLTNLTDDLHYDQSINLYSLQLAKVVEAYLQEGNDGKAKALFMACLQKIPSYDRKKLKELADEVGVVLHDDTDILNSED